MLKKIKNTSLASVLAGTLIVVLGAGLNTTPAQASQATKPQKQSADGGTFTDPVLAHDIPIRLSPLHVFLDLSVNGSKPLNFAFDTGAPISAIESTTAQMLGLKGEGTFLLGGGGPNQVMASWINGLTFKLGGVELHNQRAASMSLDMLTGLVGWPIDGIIGFDLFSRFVVEVDYAASRMRLHDPETYEYKGDGVEIPLRMMGGYFALDVTVTFPGREPIEIELLIDSGAGLNVFFTSPYTRRHDLLATLPLAIENAPARGVGGDVTSMSGRIPALQIGPFVMNEPVAHFSLDEKGAGASMINGFIGAGLLRRFTVIYDYARKRLILEPNDRLGTPFLMDLLGAGWVAGDGGDWETIKIGTIRNNSAAQAVGMEEDDVLIKVDGKPVSELGIVVLREYFQTAGQVVRLLLRRNGVEIEKEIRLKKVL